MKTRHVAVVLHSHHNALAAAHRESARLAASRKCSAHRLGLEPYPVIRATFLGEEVTTHFLSPGVQTQSILELNLDGVECRDNTDKIADIVIAARQSLAASGRRAS